MRWSGVLVAALALMVGGCGPATAPATPGATLRAVGPICAEFLDASGGIKPNYYATSTSGGGMYYGAEPRGGWRECSDPWYLGQIPKCIMPEPGEPVPACMRPE